MVMWFDGLLDKLLDPLVKWLEKRFGNRPLLLLTVIVILSVLSVVPFILLLVWGLNFLGEISETTLIAVSLAILVGIFLPPIWRRYFGKKITLDDQVTAFKQFGIKLNKGVSQKHLLNECDERQYEKAPYFLLLRVMGAECLQLKEPRRFSDQIWYFDFEAIEGEDAYVGIVQQLAGLAGVQQRLRDVTSTVDFEVGTARLAYRLDGGGPPRILHPKFDGDWADPESVKQIMQDLEESAGTKRKFWYAEDGQAVIVIFVPDEAANGINALCKGLLKPGHEIR